MRCRYGRSLVLACVLALALVLPCSPASAGDFQEEPVSLRIGLALDRAAGYADTLGRSASVAYPLGSSVNPAGYDFLREPPFDYGGVGTLMGTYVHFDRGTSVTGLTSTYAHRLEPAGTLFGIYTRTASHDGQSRQGDEFALRSDELTLGYSRRLRRGLALGGSVKLSDSFLGIDDTVAGVARNSNTDSQGLALKLGMQAALSEQWLVGATAGLGWTNSEATATVFMPGPHVGRSPLTLQDRFTTYSTNLRGGVGWRPSERLGLYADCQYLHLDNKLGSVGVGRALVGVEAFPAPALALRAGGTYDTKQNATFSAGVGYYGIQNMPLDLAYSWNPFPEVSREFGRGHLVSLSAGLSF